MRPPDSPAFDFIWITEPVRSDLPPCPFALHLEGIERYSVLSYVTNSSRRVVVPVLLPKILSGNKTVFQDMIYHCSRTSGFHLLA